jgi:hypothetical protein
MWWNCGAVTFDLEPEIPFCSVSPERMKIFYWCLQGWCIRGQRCVVWWNLGDVIFYLGAVTLNLKFPSALYVLNECRFWYCVLGDKGVSHSGIVALCQFSLLHLAAGMLSCICALRKCKIIYPPSFWLTCGSLCHSDLSGIFRPPVLTQAWHIS